MNIHQLASDEPLSPELVLVFSPELRAQVLARLGAPVWPTPPGRAVEAAAPDIAYANIFQRSWRLTMNCPKVL